MKIYLSSDIWQAKYLPNKHIRPTFVLHTKRYNVLQEPIIYNHFLSILYSEGFQYCNNPIHVHWCKVCATNLIIYHCIMICVVLYILFTFSDNSS
jgi:hypothetical protein